MPLDEGQLLRPDRNGEQHHPYCLVIGRDEWTDRILCAAWELAHAPRDERHVFEHADLLRRAVLEYDVWREQRGLRPMRFERLVVHRRRELRLRDTSGYRDGWVQEHFRFADDEEDS
jgi:hypothetical protein